MEQHRTTWFGKLPAVAAYLRRLRDPILADRSLDLMCAAFWLFLSVWGMTATITGIQTVNDSTGDWYEKVWGAAIGITCLTAFTCSVMTFLFNNPNITHRIQVKRTEMIAGSMAGGFIAVYPAVLAIAVFGGDWSRFAPLWASLVYLVIPTWRTRHLYHRIAKLRQIQEDLRDAA